MTQLRALTQLAFEELGAGAGGVGETHRAIADRAFSNPGTAKTLHDGISWAVYAALRQGATLAGRAASVVLPEREVSPALLAVLNGLRGDELEREGSALAIPMTLDAEGEATPRLAIFIHGLFETEHAWRFGGGPSYGDRLPGFSPVYARYNSGRHISENGRSLAAEIDELVAGWPVEVEQIVLVGHSMGGLVARSACHVGGDWTRRVTTSSRSARRTPARRSSRPSTTRPRRSARCPRAGRSPASSAAAAPGSATCGAVRWSTRTGTTATPTPCAPRPAGRCRCSRARCTASWPRPSRATRAIRSGAWSATGSCSRPAPATGRRRRCTWARRTTSRCSTTPRCTSSSASG